MANISARLFAPGAVIEGTISDSQANDFVCERGDSNGNRVRDYDYGREQRWREHAEKLGYSIEVNDDVPAGCTKVPNGKGGYSVSGPNISSSASVEINAGVINWGTTDSPPRRARQVYAEEPDDTETFTMMTFTGGDEISGATEEASKPVMRVGKGEKVHMEVCGVSNEVGNSKGNLVNEYESDQVERVITGSSNRVGLVNPSLNDLRRLPNNTISGSAVPTGKTRFVGNGPQTHSATGMLFKYPGPGDREHNEKTLLKEDNEKTLAEVLSEYDSDDDVAVADEASQEKMWDALAKLRAALNLR